MINKKPSTPQEAFDQVRNLFSSKFQAPNDNSVEEQILTDLLESPLFNQYVFSNNAAYIIDHSTFTYRYISLNAEDILPISRKELLEKGLSKALELMHPDDLTAIGLIFEKVTNLILTQPKEERFYNHFCYSMRYLTKHGIMRIYQQNIPITLNESGLPYLGLALVSDITPYAQYEGVTYKLSLNLPGKPVKTILSGSSNHSITPFTDREKEIVSHLAEGLDSVDIAEKLFISEGTVRTHRKNILEKTGAKNAVHLVRMAVANGWV
jgi:DNA-binding CsgD family transcriptional regulator